MGDDASMTTHYRTGYADSDHTVTSIPFPTLADALAAAEAIAAQHGFHTWVRAWPDGLVLYDNDPTFGVWVSDALESLRDTAR
jgi:hypothetical protein